MPINALNAPNAPNLNSQNDVSYSSIEKFSLCLNSIEYFNTIFKRILLCFQETSNSIKNDNFLCKLTLPNYKIFQEKNGFKYPKVAEHSLSKDIWRDFNSLRNLRNPRQQEWEFNQDINDEKISKAISSTPNFKLLIPGKNDSEESSENNISIHKKGDPSDYNNYRSISVINNGSYICSYNGEHCFRIDLVTASKIYMGAIFILPCSHAMICISVAKLYNYYYRKHLIFEVVPPSMMIQEISENLAQREVRVDAEIISGTFKGEIGGSIILPSSPLKSSKDGIDFHKVFM
ncbi:hypothetical protein H8356DRAFT_1336441 [Neocallimastix lanati (nom. inval.)]|nr:hypothetical protein H8356DRAFT_1336441 [Neocallimastix sp. JGI-2020a]